MALKVGEQAADFTLPATSGQMVSLSEDLKDKPCLIYFYPRDFTPGCTKEACGFRDNFNLFNELNIDIFGISRDTIKSHRKFRKHYDLPFELLSDPEGEVIKAYKASLPFLGITKRITYLLDREHMIQAVFKNFFAAEKHVETMKKQISLLK